MRQRGRHLLEPSVHVSQSSALTLIAHISRHVTLRATTHSEDPGAMHSRFSFHCGVSMFVSLIKSAVRRELKEQT